MLSAMSNLSIAGLARGGDYAHSHSKAVASRSLVLQTSTLTLPRYCCQVVVQPKYHARLWVERAALLYKYCVLLIIVKYGQFS